MWSKVPADLPRALEHVLLTWFDPTSGRLITVSHSGPPHNGVARARPEPGGRPRSDGLDLDFDIHPGREVEPLEGVHGLRRVVHDVHQTLVDTHLEVLPAVLVLVR